MEVTKKFCEIFNTLRIKNSSKFFTRKEIMDLLVNNIPGFTKQGYIISKFVKNGILNKTDKYHYRFTKDPVHIATLSEVVSDFKKYNCDKVKRSISKKKENNILSEEVCIKFLKEKGYKIMKAITTFEEV